MAAVCKPCAAALAMGQWLACAPSRAGAGWDSGPASEIACVCARPCCARASILSPASASKTTTKSFSTPQSVTERWPLHVSQHSSMGAECGNQLSHSQKRDGQRRGFFEPFCAECGGSGYDDLEHFGASNWADAVIPVAWVNGKGSPRCLCRPDRQPSFGVGVRRSQGLSHRVVVGGGRAAGLARDANTSPIIIYT